MATGSSWDALNREVWSAKMQVNLEKSLVAFKIARTELRDEIKDGDVIHRMYVSNVGTAEYDPGTDIVVTGASATDDTITIDQKYISAFYVDDIEMLQASLNYASELANDASYQLSNLIDTAVLENTNTIGVSALGISGSDYVTGTTAAASLTAITATSATIVQVFNAATKWLRTGNVEQDGSWVAVISPAVAGVIELAGIEKGFNVADASLKNGYAGDFLGFHIYISNNLPTSKCYIGKSKCIDLIMQRAPKMDIKEEPKKLGKNFIASTVWGDGVLHNNMARFLNAMLTA